MRRAALLARGPLPRLGPGSWAGRGPAGLEDLADLLGGDSDRSRRFLGGLIAGALAGAALAGAALVRRREGPARRR